MAVQYEMANGGTDYGAVITASASGGTKGTYVQLIAATSWDSSFQVARIVNGSSSRSNLVDVATGAAASEVVFLANVYGATGNDAGGLGGCVIEVNYDIPSGTRLAARSSSSPGASVVGFGYLLRDRPLNSLPAPVTYGATSGGGNARGTAIDPGGSVNTYGSYVEMTASSSAAHTFLSLSAMLPINTAPSYCQWNVNIATGAGGAEVVIIPNLPFQSSDLGGDCMLPASYSLAVDIPVSTRISVNAKCSTTDATDRVFNIVLYCSTQYEPAPAGGESAYTFVG